MNISEDHIKSIIKVLESIVIHDERFQRGYRGCESTLEVINLLKQDHKTVERLKEYIKVCEVKLIQKELEDIVLYPVTKFKCNNCDYINININDMRDHMTSHTSFEVIGD